MDSAAQFDMDLAALNMLAYGVMLDHLQRPFKFLKTLHISFSPRDIVSNHPACNAAFHHHRLEE